MNAVLIIVPNDATKDDIVKALKKVLSELDDIQVSDVGYHNLILDPKIDRMNTLCKNLIKKFGMALNGFSATYWLSSFFQAYYDSRDIEITSEIIEYVANASKEEEVVMQKYNLDFLIPVCRDMCNRNK